MADVPDSVTVPFRAEVPDGWEQVDPASVGVPGASLVLVDRRAADDFTPNITVGVGRRDGELNIVEVADEAIGRVAAAVRQVAVLDRTRVGDEQSPGVAQMLRMRTRAGVSGAVQNLVQSQVHMGVPLGADESLLVELACTCAEDQGSGVMPDFQRFVRTFHVQDA